MFFTRPLCLLPCGKRVSIVLHGSSLSCLMDRLILRAFLSSVTMRAWCSSPSLKNSFALIGVFTHVNKTFHTRHDFEESAVVFNIHNFTLHDFAFFDGFRQHIPWMRSQLLQTKAYTFFAIIEIEYHHLEFLIQFEYFARMTDTSPADIGDI